MGLDASVACDCYERGRASPPPVEVHINENGFLDTAATALSDQLAFDRWLSTACAHEDNTLLHHRIGNITLVAELRNALQQTPGHHSVLLQRVVHNGVHAGDFIPHATLETLADEVDGLAAILPSLEERRRALVEEFQRKMRELIAAAKAVKKPIAF